MQAQVPQGGMCVCSDLGPNGDVWRSRADLTKDYPADAERLLALYLEQLLLLPVLPCTGDNLFIKTLPLFMHQVSHTATS